MAPRETVICKRLLALLAILVVYRFLSHVPIPLAEPTQLKTILDNALSSSQFGGFSI